MTVGLAERLDGSRPIFIEQVGVGGEASDCLATRAP
jgi:hypothetical protein